MRGRVRVGGMKKRSDVTRVVSFVVVTTLVMTTMPANLCALAPKSQIKKVEDVLRGVEQNSGRNADVNEDEEVRNVLSAVGLLLEREIYNSGPELKNIHTRLERERKTNSSLRCIEEDSILVDGNDMFFAIHSGGGRVYIKVTHLISERLEEEESFFDTLGAMVHELERCVEFLAPLRNHFRLSEFKRRLAKLPADRQVIMEMTIAGGRAHANTAIVVSAPEYLAAREKFIDLTARSINRDEEPSESSIAMIERMPMLKNDERVKRTLIEKAERGDTNAICGLRLYQDSDSRDVLTRLLNAGHSSSKRAAVDVLAGHADRHAVECLSNVLMGEKDREVIEASVSALAGIIRTQPAMTDVMMQKLNDSDLDMRPLAIRILMLSENPKWISVVEEMSKDSSSQVRLAAVEALSAYQGIDPSVRAILARALKDEESTVRAKAVEVLAQADDPGLVPQYIEMLEDISHQVRLCAAQALRRYTEVDKSAKEAFNSHVRIEPPRYQEPIWNTAAEPDGPSDAPDDGGEWIDEKLIISPVDVSMLSMDALITGLTDSDSIVRWEAVRELNKRSTGGVVNVIPSTDQFVGVPISSDFRNAVKLILSGEIEKAVTILGEIVQSGRDPRQRAFALDLLVHQKTESAQKYVLYVLQNDQDVSVFQRAVRAAGELKVRAAVEVLVSKGLKSGNNITVDYAARALGEIGHERAGAPLLALLQSCKNPSVRRVAINAIAALKYRPAVDILIGLLKRKERGLGDSDDETVHNAALALGQIGDERAGAPLLALLPEQKNGYIQAAVIKALGELRYKPALDALIELLKGSSWSPELTEALSKFKERRVVKALMAALARGGGPVMVKIMDALGEIGDPEAVPALSQFLSDYPYDFSRDAMNALLKMDKVAIEPLKTELASEESRPPGWRENVQRVLIQLGDSGTVNEVIQSRTRDVEMVEVVGKYCRTHGGHKVVQWLQEELLLANGKLNWRNATWVAIRGRDEKLSDAAARALCAVGKHEIVRTVQNVVPPPPSAADIADAAEAAKKQYDEAYFDLVERNVAPLIKLIENQRVFQDEKAKTKSRTQALLSLIGKSSSKAGVRRYLLRHSSIAVRPLLAALQSADGRVRQFAYETIRRISPARLSRDDAAQVNEFEEFMRQVSTLRRALQTEDVAKVAQMFDRIVLAKQVLELAKFLATRDAVVPLAQALEATTQGVLEKGDIIEWWLAELVNKEYAADLMQSGTPKVAETARNIKKVLDELSEADELLAQGKEAEALAVVEEELGNAGDKTFLWNTATAVLFSDETRMPFKILIAKAIKNVQEKAWVNRTEFFLTPSDKWSLWPLEFKETEEAKTGGIVRSRRPGRGTHFVDLSIEEEGEVSDDL